jgi:hypothetical protein
MEIVEVFKTNVETDEQASRLTHHIHENFNGCQVNFDLEDCDRILRFQSSTGIIPTDQLIRLMQAAGFQAEILPDEVPPFIGSAVMLSAS